MEVTIRVTQEHIDKGKRVSECSCPIALAAKDAGVVKPSVGCLALSVGERWHDRQSRYLPASAQNFIEEFDLSGPVSPFEFNLDIPAEFLSTAAATLSANVPMFSGGVASDTAYIVGE